MWRGACDLAGEPGRKFLLKTIGRRDGAIVCRISLSPLPSRTNDGLTRFADRHGSSYSHSLLRARVTHKICQLTECVARAQAGTRRERAVRASKKKRLFVLCSGYHRFAPTLLRDGVSLFIARDTPKSRERCHCFRSRGETSVAHIVALRVDKERGTGWPSTGRPPSGGFSLCFSSSLSQTLATEGRGLTSTIGGSLRQVLFFVRIFALDSEMQDSLSQTFAAQTCSRHTRRNDRRSREGH